MEKKGLMQGFPEEGQTTGAILEQLRQLKARDVDWLHGRNFAYVYYAGPEELALAKEAYQIYFSENALNPTAFPSLQRMEKDIIRMARVLFHAPEQAAGNLTSGGTESILMAVKAAKHYFQKSNPSEATPEVILPASAHPAFHKACDYFGLKPIVVPVDAQFQAIPAAYENAITARTALVVASAPSYPQGMIDPIEGIAAIAASKGVLCHVDACVGGFLLPFLEDKGVPIPPFDFRIPGVTSISADIHKYGFAAKGASLVLYRNPELRKCQFYAYTDWSGGIYASPSLVGTRPGGAIAAAWAMLHFMGRKGYQKKAMQSLVTAERLRTAIRQIPELKILGAPRTSLFAIASDQLDIYEIGDELSLRGWYMDRQQLPPSLHLTITPAHAAVAQEFLADLEEAVRNAKRFKLHRLGKAMQVGLVRGARQVLPRPWLQRLQQTAGKWLKVESGGRSAAMYGMMGTLQGEGNLDDLVKEVLHKMT